MNTKYIFGVIAVIVVLAIGFFLIDRSNSPTPEVMNKTDNVNSNDSVSSENTNINEIQETNTVTNSNAATSTNEVAAPATGEPVMPQDADIAVFEIIYNGTSFAPSQLTIKAGDVVIFKNESDKSFWPASGPHPEHTNYPEFDPKKAITPGQDWQFKFLKNGSWPFHDHLNPSVIGKITVQ